jgi:hypothetical protein
MTNGFKVLGWVLGCGLAIQVAEAGTISEVEPNSSCSELQQLGKLDISTQTVAASVDAGDVDFFQFSGTPGNSVSLTVRAESSDGGTLPDPILGVFDKSCYYPDVIDDVNGADPSTKLIVPDSGIVIVAVGAYPDFSFSGGGNSTGSYQLDIGIGPATMITGVARTTHGEPQPSFSATLYRCDDADPDQTVCNDYATSTYSSSADGQFVLTSTAINPGTYQVALFPNESQQNTTYSEKFDYSGTSVDLGTINIASNPIYFGQANVGNSGSSYYAATPGETVSIRYTATNTTTTTQKLVFWTSVMANGLEGPSYYSDFTVAQRSESETVRLGPGETRLIEHILKLPSDMGSGGSLSLHAYASQTNKLSPQGDRYAGSIYVVSSNQAKSHYNANPDLLRKRAQRERNTHSR